MDKGLLWETFVKHYNPDECYIFIDSFYFI